MPGTIVTKVLVMASSQQTAWVTRRKPTSSTNCGGNDSSSTSSIALLPEARMGTIDFEAASSSSPSAAQDHMPGSACSLRKDRQVATATVKMASVDAVCDIRCYKLE